MSYNLLLISVVGILIMDKAHSATCFTDPGPDSTPPVKIGGEHCYTAPGARQASPFSFVIDNTPFVSSVDGSIIEGIPEALANIIHSSWNSVFPGQQNFVNIGVGSVNTSVSKNIVNKDGRNTLITSGAEFLPDCGNCNAITINRLALGSNGQYEEFVYKNWVGHAVIETDIWLREDQSWVLQSRGDICPTSQGAPYPLFFEKIINHEFGHSLGLSHIYDPTNFQLMEPGPTQCGQQAMFPGQPEISAIQFGYADHPKTDISISSPSNNEKISWWDNLLNFVFRASATDPDGNDASDQIVWISDVDGEFGNGPTVPGPPLRSGFHTIRAKVEGNEQQQAAKSSAATVSSTTVPSGEQSIIIELVGPDIEYFNATADPCFIYPGSSTCQTTVRWRVYGAPFPGRVKLYADATGSVLKSGPANTHTVSIPKGHHRYSLRYDSGGVSRSFDEITVVADDVSGTLTSNVQQCEIDPFFGTCEVQLSWSSFAPNPSIYNAAAGAWVTPDNGVTGPSDGTVIVDIAEGSTELTLYAERDLQSLSLASLTVSAFDHSDIYEEDDIRRFESEPGAWTHSTAILAGATQPKHSLHNLSDVDFVNWHRTTGNYGILSVRAVYPRSGVRPDVNLYCQKRISTNGVRTYEPVALPFVGKRSGYRPGEVILDFDTTSSTALSGCYASRYLFEFTRASGTPSETDYYDVALVDASEDHYEPDNTPLRATPISLVSAKHNQGKGAHPDINLGNEDWVKMYTNRDVVIYTENLEDSAHTCMDVYRGYTNAVNKSHLLASSCPSVSGIPAMVPISQNGAYSVLYIRVYYPAGLNSLRTEYTVNWAAVQAGANATAPTFANKMVQSYAPNSQDLESKSYYVNTAGDTLTITGNAWKATANAYAVTPNTWIEFDYISTGETPEIAGVGIDNNLSWGPLRFWQVHGTQNYYNTDFKNYSGSGWKTYKINIGAYYTGAISHVLFANDMDSAGKESVVSYRNFRLYEDVSAADGPDSYDHVSTRGYSDDIVGDASPWLSSQNSHNHNFHDAGDIDWSIVAVGAGGSAEFRTELVGASAAVSLSVFRWNSATPRADDPNRYTNVSQTFLHSDTSSGENRVTVYNSSNATRIYAIKAFSRNGVTGADSAYKIHINRAFKPDNYDREHLRGYNDDYVGDGESWLVGHTYQEKNFHDKNDQDWVIVAVPAGQTISYSLQRIGSEARPKMSLYEWTAANVHPTNSSRFTDVQQILLGSSTSTITRTNTSSSTKIYAIRIFSSVSSYWGSRTTYRLKKN